MNNFESLQTGSVRKKGSQWYYRFRIKDQDGNWKMHEFKGGQTKAETTFMLKQALEEYRQDGSIFYAGSLTVGQLADMWYNAEIENSNLTTNGKYGYKNVINNIHNNPFSQIKLKDLTIEDIQEYVDGLYFGVYDNEGNQIAKPYAKATMRKFFLVLNNMFKYAVYPKKLLRENLMQYVKKRKVAKDNSLFGNSNEAKIQTITHQEFLKIINYLSSVEDYCYLALPIQIAYHTGMRAGEVCGLTWDDIDFETGMLIISKTLYYKTMNDYKFVEPKTQASNRTIYIDADTIKELQEWKAVQAKVLPNCGFVLSYNSTPTSKTTLPRALEKLANLAGVHRIKIHALRHSHASLLISMGENPLLIKERLGHEKIQTTLGTYGHLYPNTNIEIAKKLTGVLSYQSASQSIANYTSNQHTAMYHKEI